LKLTVDSHTHTLASGHAYSTIQECAREAADKGIRLIAMTDHGPAIEGTTGIAHFWNLKIIPDEIYGVRIIKGVEANIIDWSGKLDLPDGILSRLDFVIAGLHDVSITPASVEEHTEAMLAAYKNPLVDTVAHPGNPVFSVDIDRVVKAAAENGKLIEINNHSFTGRKGSTDNCRMFVKCCKKYGARITCGSDAHISFNVGVLDIVKTLLEEEGIPEEQVVCSSAERFMAYLEERRKRLETYTSI
jgi:putative hydrolase